MSWTQGNRPFNYRRFAYKPKQLLSTTYGANDAPTTHLVDGNERHFAWTNGRFLTSEMCNGLRPWTGNFRWRLVGCTLCSSGSVFTYTGSIWPSEPLSCSPAPSKSRNQRALRLLDCWLSEGPYDSCHKIRTNFQPSLITKCSVRWHFKFHVIQPNAYRTPGSPLERCLYYTIVCR